MKRIILSILLLLPTPILAQSGPFLVPMLGQFERTEKQRQDKEKLIESIFDTKEKACAYYLKYALEALHKRKLDEAMSKANHAWLTMPEEPQVYQTFGLILLKRKKYDQALEIIQKGAVINPTNEILQATFEELKPFLKSDLNAREKKKISYIIKSPMEENEESSDSDLSEPIFAQSDPQLIPMLGQTERTDKQKQDKKLLIESFFDTKEKACAYYLKYALEALHRGDLDEAMSKANHAWLTMPENGETYQTFALILLKREKHDQALEMLTKGTEIAPINEMLLSKFEDLKPFLKSELDAREKKIVTYIIESPIERNEEPGNSDLPVPKFEYPQKPMPMFGNNSEAIRRAKDYIYGFDDGFESKEYSKIKSRMTVAGVTYTNSENRVKFVPKKVTKKTRARERSSNAFNYGSYISRSKEYLQGGNLGKAMLYANYAWITTRNYTYDPFVNPGELHYTFSEILLARKDSKDAMFYIKMAIKSDPDNTLYLKKLEEISETMEDWEIANKKEMELKRMAMEKEIKLKRIAKERARIERENKILEGKIITAKEYLYPDRLKHLLNNPNLGDEQTRTITDTIELIDWKIADSSKDIESYNRFIETLPNSEWVAEAEIAIKSSKSNPASN